MLYKCITKILANRVKSCLSDLISPSQTPFVKWRIISEKILLAQELVKCYHRNKGKAFLLIKKKRNKGKARCAIKVDLKKDYDSVEWNFILMCLLAVGCPAKYVNWVDTSIILIKAAFEELKGLSVNQSKSEVFCSAVPASLQAQILSILRFRAWKLPVRYSGIPLIAGKLSFTDCAPLIDKITARIRCWTAKYLSFSGRVQLIQSMLILSKYSRPTSLYFLRK